jgi:hypothetical protein
MARGSSIWSYLAKEWCEPDGGVLLHQHPARATIRFVLIRVHFWFLFCAFCAFSRLFRIFVSPLRLCGFA